MGVISSLVEVLIGFYSGILEVLPTGLQKSFSVLMLAIFVSVVAIFIWYFYKSLSQRDLISLNLNKYNTSSHPGFSKFFAVILYFVEYALIMPLLIFVWFVALSFIIVLISEQGNLGSVLLLTAVMVASIRILAYVRHEISQDLAKLFPFITLSIFLLTPGAFDLSGIVNRSTELVLLSGDVFSFFLVIFSVEIFLRLIFVIKEGFSSERKSVDSEE
jgi:hypothetical protein